MTQADVAISWFCSLGDAPLLFRGCVLALLFWGSVPAPYGNGAGGPAPLKFIFGKIRLSQGFLRVMERSACGEIAARASQSVVRVKRGSTVPC